MKRILSIFVSTMVLLVLCCNSVAFAENAAQPRGGSNCPQCGKLGYNVTTLSVGTTFLKQGFCTHKPYGVDNFYSDTYNYQGTCRLCSYQIAWSNIVTRVDCKGTLRP